MNLDEIPLQWSVTIVRSRTFGLYTVFAKAWIDNGYGGSELSLSHSSGNLNIAIQEVVREVKEYEKEYGSRLH